MCVCACVCLYPKCVARASAKTTGPILMKFGGKVWTGVLSLHDPSISDLDRRSRSQGHFHKNANIS